MLEMHMKNSLYYDILSALSLPAAVNWSTVAVDTSKMVEIK